jgi:hypothetical protein
MAGDKRGGSRGEGEGGLAKIFLVVNRKTIIFAEKSDDAGGHQEGIG